MAEIVNHPSSIFNEAKKRGLNEDVLITLIKERDVFISSGYPNEISNPLFSTLIDILCEHPELRGQFVDSFIDLILVTSRKNSAASVIQLIDSFKSLAAEGPGALLVWFDTVKRLVSLAPRNLDDFMLSAPLLIEQGLVRNAENWIIACVRGSGLDPQILAEHLRLQTRASNVWLSQEIGSIYLTNVLKRAKAEVDALWGLDIQISEIPVISVKSSVQRPSFFGSKIRLPRSYPGMKGELSEVVHAASLHHVAAHLTFRSKPYERGSFKPIQIALASIFEDCRCELLAMNQYPGLRRIWDLFNIRPSSNSLSAESVFKRLSYKILNPNAPEKNGWIMKAYEAFYDHRREWQDENIARDLGNILGNDLGQMRIQFNAKTYLPAPIYRDDNQGIWNLDDDIDNAQQSVSGEGIDVEYRDSDEGKRDENNSVVEPSKKVNSIPLQTDEQPQVITTQGEYDYLNGVFVDDFVTLKSRPIKRPLSHVELTAEFETITKNITATIKQVVVNKNYLKRSVPYGDRLNIDAAIGAAIDLRMGVSTEERYYDSVGQTGKSLSVQIVLDVSESTRELVPEINSPLLKIAVNAVDILATSLSDAGDPFGVFTFCSDGREDVRIGLIKDYDEEWASVRARLHKAESGLSTRTGAAIRFAGTLINDTGTYRKLVLVITDGEPFDLDVSDAAYFVEDARHAVVQLRRQSIDVHCISIGNKTIESLERVYGKGAYSTITDVRQLAEKIGHIYAVLSK